MAWSLGSLGFLYTELVIPKSKTFNTQVNLKTDEAALGSGRAPDESLWFSNVF